MKKYISLFLSLLFTASIFTGCSSKKVSDINNYVSKVEDIKVNDDIKIVGLGEATHGNHEMQNLKLEVFKSLVKNNNCRVFAIEGDFGGCAKVNEYINGGEGNAKDAAAEIKFAIYRTEEIQSLIEWMREYNKNASEEEKLKFYGFDMQRYDNSKELLFSYLDKVDKNLGEEYKDSLKDLNDDTAYDQDKDKVKECAESIEELINKMTENKDEFIEKTSNKEFDFAFQCADSIKENTSLRTAGVDYSNLRDEYMKNKIDWIYNFEDEKLIFINGHNGHIEKTSASKGIKKCMGERLSESYGNSYYAIGTDFIESSFNVNSSSGKNQVITINNSNKLSSQFKDLDNNEYFMDISRAEENSELKEILDSKIRMNNIGSEFNSWQKICSIFYTLNIIPSKAYNAVIIVKTATPSTCVD